MSDNTGWGPPPPGPGPGPAGGPPGYGAPPPAPPGYGAPPPAPPGYGPPPGSAPGYGPPPGLGPQGGAYPPGYGAPVYFGPRPDAPSANTSLILGILGVVLCAVCAPFAIVYGRRAEEEVRLSNGAYGGAGQAKAGIIMGIIGSILLGVIVAGVIVVIILAIANPNAFDESVGRVRLA